MRPAQQGTRPPKAEDKWLITRVLAFTGGQKPRRSDIKSMLETDSFFFDYAQKKYPDVKAHLLLRKMDVLLKYKNF